MSLIVGSRNLLESEVGGEVISTTSQPPFLPGYRTKRNSHSCDDASSYDDGDRPLSRLTITESASESHDLEEDLASIVGLDSPDLPDDYFPTSPSFHPVSSRSGAHTCEECLKTFSSPGKLRQHEYSHTGETPYECKIQGCDKKFTSKFKLKRHILIHSQTKTFTCDTCNRAFRRKDHLKNHEKVHDPGKTVYSCSYESCGRTYNSLSSYKKHQAMHSAEDGQLDCKICKAVLLSQEELMNHLKIHASSRTGKGAVDKKFGCGQCDKKFFTRKDLKRHSVVHTGNREFCCPHCTQRFGRKDHMTRHAKKTHAQFYDSLADTRHRQPSTPSSSTGNHHLLHHHDLPPRGCSRKERSISDPGPSHLRSTAVIPLSPPPLLSQQPGANPPTTDFYHALTPATSRPLLSPTVVLDDFQRLGTEEVVVVPGVPTNPSPSPSSASSSQSSTAISDSSPPTAPCLVDGACADPLMDLVTNTKTLIPLSGYQFTVAAGGVSSSSPTSVIRKSIIAQTHPIKIEPTKDILSSFGIHSLGAAGGGGGGEVVVGGVKNNITLSGPASQLFVGMPPLIPSAGRDNCSVTASIKQEDIFSDDDDSNSVEDPMKELMDEKNRMDIATFISQYDEDAFNKSLQQPPPTTHNHHLHHHHHHQTVVDIEKIFLEEEVKDEPRSRPSSSVGFNLVEDHQADVEGEEEETTTSTMTTTTTDGDKVLGTYRGGSVVLVRGPAIPSSVSRVYSSSCSSNGVSSDSPHHRQQQPRPIFLRTQSQDSLTRTKNPVLPSVHTEIPLVVPEPKAMRYPNPDPFTLDFDEESSHQLTELKGSLFLSDEYSQGYFQPWN